MSPSVVSHRALGNTPTSFKPIVSRELGITKYSLLKHFRLNKLASFDLGVFDENRLFNGVTMMMIFIYVEETSRRA